MTDAATLLALAKGLIRDKRNWLRGEYAKNADGRIVPPNDKGACRFCAVGALAYVADTTASAVEKEKVPAGTFLKQATLEFGEKYPSTINDEDGHEAVMKLYDRAIELALAAQASSVAAGER